MEKTNRILIVATSADEYEKVGYRTGLWLGELTHFFDVAEEAGYSVDIASPKGGKIPIDAESLSCAMLKYHGTGERYKDRKFMDLLDRAMRLDEARVENYDAIYMTGGHGVCFDFPNSATLINLVGGFYEAGKVVSAVCHGPAGLLEVKLGDGEYLVKDKKLTAFSWKEESAADRADAVPFNLEEELKQRGAKYEKAWLPMGKHVVVDGNLITGQNPTSARGVGKAVIKALGK